MGSKTGKNISTDTAKHLEPFSLYIYIFYIHIHLKFSSVVVWPAKISVLLTNLT